MICENCGRPGVSSRNGGVCEFCGQVQEVRTPEENMKRGIGMILGGILLILGTGWFAVKSFENDPARLASISGHDTQMADSIHTAVLTAILDPEIKAKKEYAEDFAVLTEKFDITECQIGENCILDEAARIMYLDDFRTLRDQLRSKDATGRIWVTVTEHKDSEFPSLEVVLDGAIDNGEGGDGKREITIR